MHDIAGVVILFFPDEDFINRARTYSGFVKRLYIIDNTDTPHYSFETRNDNIFYISNKENKGISKRLNQAAELALQEGFNWLLTMDQDSFFPEHMVSTYFNCIEQFPKKDDTAMFGVQFENEETGKSCQSEEVPHLITSGSVLNLSLFKTIGPFDEALFIDKVDHEYCFRARLKGFKIIMFNNIFLHHNLGKIKYGRSLKTLKITPRVVHSPIRMYYILRNYFYLKKKYRGQFVEEFRELKKELRLRIKNNFLYGNNRFQLLTYLLKGYSDYKKNKMGKIS